MLLVEAAGSDMVIVETVGVGQSETAVSEWSTFLSCCCRAGGDELQGIKSGIVEWPTWSSSTRRTERDARGCRAGGRRVSQRAEDAASADGELEGAGSPGFLH